MSETKNLKLHLTEDSSEHFRSWREEMNGANNSNMIKIDEEVSKKADKSKTVETVLFANQWNGDKTPFTQELFVDGLGVEQNGTISVSISATPQEREAAGDGVLSIAKQEEEKLIITADGERPEIDIPVSIILFG